MEARKISDFPKAEEEILNYWEENGIFEKLRNKNRGKRIFVFLEGPPTANGMPHIGHALTRAMKDIFLRYKAMDGYEIYPWIAGWDCHGLPVEIEVEKKLGINSKKEIEKFGVEKFNRLCKESVFRYRGEWIRMSKRIGFWIDYENAYVTMKDYYIESVWWALKKIYERGLLVKDYKVVPYCPRCGTPLSSHEVAQGYKITRDPSIYVKFKVKDENAYFLVWTTTPWTLPSNLLLAVGEDIEYSLVEYGGERYYIARERITPVLGDARIIKNMKGRDLRGKRYERLIPFVPVDFDAFYVTTADFVSTEDGTGIVHIAPAFGEDDHDLCRRENIPLIKPVDEEGKFITTPWRGMFVKDADREIIKWLRQEGKLLKSGSVEHMYPFCWRCGTPMLYYALDTWYIKMSKLREELMRNNEEVNWKPEHLKHGRFGKFLEEVKDWALSRNRYWGTPLPIWRCPSGHVFIPESKEDLLEHADGDSIPENFELHRPYVDQLNIKCPVCGREMVREPYLIDVWFDSGSSFFAQFHYPYENEENFKKAFPVDFITEAIDQTRGWFYTLMAISTLLFDKPSYKNVLTLGLILDEDGEKMSKSKGNAIDPMKIMDNVGADAVRLYLFSSPAWKSRRFSENLVREYMQRTIATLWNVLVFFKNNAELDDYHGEEGEVKKELDRWLISRLNTVIGDVRKNLDNYEVHRATKEIEIFIDELSNWYLRRSRRRFWKEGMDEDKLSAYFSLYTSLKKLSVVMAPFTPFLAESIYRELWGERESVHLEDYPPVEERLIDKKLEEEMNIAMRIAEAGRRARQISDIKLRQPLSEMLVVGDRKYEKIVEKFRDVLKEEVNVKSIKVKESAGEMTKIEIRVNYRNLGPRLKKDLRRVVEEINKMDAREIARKLKHGNIHLLGYEIGEEDIEIFEKPVEGMNAVEVTGLPIVIYLNTHITRELRMEGFAREIVRRIQAMRKEMNLKYDEKIETRYYGDGELEEAIEKFRDYIMRETQSIKLERGEGGDYEKNWKIDGKNIKIVISS